MEGKKLREILKEQHLDKQKVMEELEQTTDTQWGSLNVLCTGLL